jgi:SPP1 gp7 family putative phage head morphogenesis protein
MKSAVDDKFELLYNSPRQFVDAFNSMAESMLKQDDVAVRRKSARLADLIGETMALADLLGRKRLLMEIDAHDRKRRAPLLHRVCGIPTTFMTTSVVPNVPFKEAYEDILRREPRLVKSREEIARAYSGDNGFAIMNLPKKLAENARLKLLQRVQKAIADFAAKGMGLGSVREKLSAIGGFTRAYAENIYRTNLSTAFTAGRMKQMRDPDVLSVAPAFEFDAVNDSSTTKWCKNTHGLIAMTTDPAWDRYSPPLHWQCRSDLRVVDKYELRDRGILKSLAKKPHYPANIAKGGPAPGFKVDRTDRRVYGFKASGEGIWLRPWMIYENSEMGG